MCIKEFDQVDVPRPSVYEKCHVTGTTDKFYYIQEYSFLLPGHIFLYEQEAFIDLEDDSDVEEMVIEHQYEEAWSSANWGIGRRHGRIETIYSEPIEIEP